MMGALFANIPHILVSRPLTRYFSPATMTTGVSVRTAVSLCDVSDGQLYALYLYTS
jgi:hypothetical protein